MAKELTCIQLEDTYSQVMVTRKLKLLKMTVVFINKLEKIIISLIRKEKIRELESVYTLCLKYVRTLQ